VRYALLVEYDGTEFHGSQLQTGVRTVQGELEAALEKIYGTFSRARFAGRTDSGVHALGQVAAVDLDDRHSTGTLRDALNFHLPDDVAIRAIEIVAEEFDPRRDAVLREYVYSIADGGVRPALKRRLHTKTELLERLEDMDEAAKALTGTHDFASFAGPATPADASTVRRIESIRIVRTGESTCRVRVIGNAFVHQQVRRMTGALVRVGTGKSSIEEVRMLV